MNYSSIIKNLFSKKPNTTPQSQPLPGQIPNNAGGYYYALNDWARLDRFLILGTEAGTYYVTPVQLTKENATVLLRLLAIDGPAVIERIVQISTTGRAPKNDPVLFALALAASDPNEATRKAALNALSKIARIGTHLLMFTDFIKSQRGWGRGLRKALGNWFLDMPHDRLALQAIKYNQRNGWKLRDILRLAHPHVHTPHHAALVDWIAHPDKKTAQLTAQQLFPLIAGKIFVQALADEKAHPNAVADIIRHYQLPREAVPTDYLNYAEVWSALLENMPMTAMIRSLGKMSNIGLLAPTNPASKFVANSFINREQLKKAKVHPMQLLLALRTYAQGCGELGKLTWQPVPEILHALNEAFELSFEHVEPTRKRILVGVDFSGSMAMACAGSPVLNCFVAALAMAVMFARIEPHARTIIFDTHAHEFPIPCNQRLDEVIARLQAMGGGTDLSQPIVYALEKNIMVDAFVVLTDNETWAGKIHPAQALKLYREKINPHVKLIVLAAAATQGSVCDPEDPLSFGIAGFDAAAPQLVTNFIRGEL